MSLDSAKPKGSRLSEKTKNIMDLALKGERPRDIAAALGLPQSDVNETLRRLRKYGHDVPRCPEGNLSKESILCRDLAKEGYAPADIARALKIPAAKVRETLRRLRKRGHDIPRYSLNPEQRGEQVPVHVSTDVFFQIQDISLDYGMTGRQAIRSLLAALASEKTLLVNLLDVEA